MEMSRMEESSRIFLKRLKEKQFFDLLRVEAGVNRLRWGPIPDSALALRGVGMVGGWSWKEKAIWSATIEIQWHYDFLKCWL